MGLFGVVGSNSLFSSVRLSSCSISGGLVSFHTLTIGIASSSSGSLLSFILGSYILLGGFLGLFGGFPGGQFSIEDVLFQISGDVSGVEGFPCIVHLRGGGSPCLLCGIPGTEGSGSVSVGFEKGSNRELAVVSGSLGFLDGGLHRFPGELVGGDGGLVGLDSSEPVSLPSGCEQSGSERFLLLREVDADLLGSDSNEPELRGLPFSHLAFRFAEGTHGVEERLVSKTGILVGGSSSLLTGVRVLLGAGVVVPVAGATPEGSTVFEAARVVGLVFGPVLELHVRAVSPSPGSLRLGVGGTEPELALGSSICFDGGEGELLFFSRLDGSEGSSPLLAGGSGALPGELGREHLVFNGGVGGEGEECRGDGGLDEHVGFGLFKLIISCIRAFQVNQNRPIKLLKIDTLFYQ